MRLKSRQKKKVTDKASYGTLSTIGSSDKKNRSKEPDVIARMKALANGRHDAKRDRFSEVHQSWEYSIHGRTIDERLLRIGISFEVILGSGENILVVTVIDPNTD